MKVKKQDEDTYITEDGEVDFDNGTTSHSFAMGSHAVTASGYILDVDEQEPVNSVKALFIIDPDNDAHDHNMPKEARGNEQKLKAERPNTMQLFITSPVNTGSDDDDDDDYDDPPILNLEDYMKDAATLIASITGLAPAP